MQQVVAITIVCRTLAVPALARAADNKAQRERLVRSGREILAGEILHF